MHVLFDWGGVIAEFSPERRLAAMSGEWNLPQARIHERFFASGFSERQDRGQLGAHEAFEWATRELALHCAFDDFRRLWLSAFSLRPGFLELVDRVRVEHRTSLFTNNGRLLRDGLKQWFPGVEERFDPIFFSCELGALKPEPEVFRAVVDALGCPPGELLLVDDSAPNVAAAARAGWRTIHYQSFPALPAALAATGALAVL